MNRTEGSSLQLRILSGMHAGARALLEDDEYMLGALDDCDFVLTDEGVQPHHALLSRRGESWQLDWIAGEGGEPVLAPMRLDPGKAIPLGPIVVAVDECDAHWPTLEQLVLVPHAPALEPSLPPPAETEPASAGFIARLRKQAGAHVLTVGTGAVACISAVAMVASPMSMEDHAKPPVPAAVTFAVPAPDPAQKNAIEAALADLGLGGRVKIETAGAGWLVRAQVMTDAEGESLSAALARLKPRPALRMTTERELRDDVTDMLLRLGPEYRGKISLRSLGDGRLRLDGRMATVAERDKLLRALATAFPHVRDWENAIASDGEAGDELVSKLRSYGWPIHSEWDKGTLVLEAKLHQRDVGRWESALLAAPQINTVPFRAKLVFTDGGTPPRPSAEVRLPFEIRGVVGGDMPYVVLTDGEKLAQGGSWQGWRLAAINAGQVVFENGGRRAVVQR